MDDLDHVEGILGSDGIDEYVAMYPDGVLGIDRRVLILRNGTNSSQTINDQGNAWLIAPVQLCR